MDKKELIELVLKPFFSQVEKGGLETAMFPKVYCEGIRIKVGLGHGKASNVPFVSFLGEFQENQNGIYPVVAYFKNHGVLFLAYGESVNHKSSRSRYTHRIDWGRINENMPLMESYFENNGIALNGCSETRYVHERYYSVYELHGGRMGEEDMDKLVVDIEGLVRQYEEIIRTKVCDDGLMQGVGEDAKLMQGVFKYTATSYKYYWALALLDLVGEGRLSFSMYEGVIGMMLRAWKPAVVEGRSVGGQDRLYERVREVRDRLGIDLNMDMCEIRMMLYRGLENGEVRRIYSMFEGNVPYRFLSPWINYKSNDVVEQRSRTYSKKCPYAIWSESIRVNPYWLTFLRVNNERLKAEVEEKLNKYLNK